MGTLYEEFPIVKAQRGVQAARVIDGLVVLGTPPRRVPRGKPGRNERAAANLDGEDVLVIQTKGTRLNPYVFGQALLSMELIQRRWSPRSLRIQRRWSPRSLRSVLICVKDDPELRPITGRYPDLEVRLERPVRREQSFHLARLPGAVASVAARLGGSVVEPARVGSNVTIDGVVIPRHRARGVPLRQAVPGRDVVSVHTYVAKDGAARLSMSVGGEVIMAQALLIQMGAASARSVVVAHHRDAAIEAALARYADFEIGHP
ncbi:MAG TPA: hypothetical protein VK457_13910 [Chloroflexota bacterium]|nr:hypothetical protein [Chloroflexota bacterium]